MMLVARAVLALVTVPAVAETADGGFSAPPEGFDARREGIEHGKLESVEYDSTTVGIKRKARVYTPPGYAGRQTGSAPVQCRFRRQARLQSVEERPVPFCSTALS